MAKTIFFKVLVCTGSCCVAPSDAEGRNFIAHSAISRSLFSRGETQLATEKGQLPYPMVQSPSFLLLPRALTMCMFPLQNPEQIHSPGRQQPLPTRWRWEGSGGTELQSQLPTQPSWNSPSLPGPAQRFLSCPHHWTQHP